MIQAPACRHHHGALCKTPALKSTCKQAPEHTASNINIIGCKCKLVKTKWSVWWKVDR